MESISLTLDAIGKILIAYAALRVHHRVLAEHSIDAKVFRSMKREQMLGILGVMFILAAYGIDLNMLMQ